MKKLKIGFAIIFILTLWSCGTKSETYIDAIPQNAKMVVEIRTSSLASKVGKESIKQFKAPPMPIAIWKNTPPMARELFQNPETTGIDILKPTYLFSFAPNEKEETFALLLPIEDAELFSNFVKQQSREEIQSTNGYKFVEKSKEGKIAWKDNFAILALSQDGKGRVLSNTNLNSLMNFESSNSVVQNANFSGFLKGKHDIAMWMNSSFYNLEELQDIQYFNDVNLKNIDKEQLKDNYLHFLLRFDDGKVSLKTKFFPNPDLPKENQKLWKGEKFESDLLDYIPNKHPLAFGTGFTTKKMLETVLDKKSLKKAGISQEEFLEVFGGSYEMVVTDIKPMYVVSRGGGLFFGSQKPQKRVVLLPEVILATSIENKEMCHKILADLQHQLEKEFSAQIFQDGDTYRWESKKGMPTFYLRVFDEALVLSNNEDLVEGKQNESISGEFEDMISSSVSSYYLNLDTEKYSKNTHQLIKNKTFFFYNQVIDALGKFEDVRFTVEKSGNEATLELHLKDKSKNSLYNLIEISNDATSGFPF
jgi:hypothetical protein